MKAAEIFTPFFRKMALFVWICAIWIGSLIPLSAPPVSHGDKFEHFIGYAVLAVLGFLNWPRLFYVWLAASLMGVSVEIAQSFTSWRSFDLYDMLANSIGACIGLIVCLLCSRKSTLLLK
ncbi:VanZ family protein [Chitinibacter bivalviorum]|uniref:VanZ family protein n=1 Tax=Chitinibacter bivalviorum TaxID=2739434 RepID=A0A7H9BFR6_9NEIS|nr:VanZ family protein [Chitinibacter bivalviorum]QLG87553.1 VanZ family protein [Chitinibacter bivalviorum]